MPLYISKIKLPDSSTFNIKDKELRDGIDNIQNSKQDILIAGTGIKIENNVISLDTTNNGDV